MSLATNNTMINNNQGIMDQENVIPIQQYWVTNVSINSQKKYIYIYISTIKENYKKKAKKNKKTNKQQKSSISRVKNTQNRKKEKNTKTHTQNLSKNKKMTKQ